MTFFRLACCLCVCTVGFAGVIRGTVRSNDVAVSGAKVVIYNELSMIMVQRVVSDRNGQYQVTLAAGPYRVMVFKKGFLPDHSSIILRNTKGDQRVRHDLNPDLPISDNQGMRDLKHILRNTEREPLKEVTLAYSAALKREMQRDQSISGSMTTASHMNLQGDVETVSVVHLDTLITPHMRFRSDIRNEEQVLGDEELNALGIDAGLTYEGQRWGLDVHAQQIRPTSSDQEQSSQSLSLSSSMADERIRTKVVVRESRRTDLNQGTLHLHQQFRHNLYARPMGHELQVRHWTANERFKAHHLSYRNTWTGPTVAWKLQADQLQSEREANLQALWMKARRTLGNSGLTVESGIGISHLAISDQPANTRVSHDHKAHWQTGPWTLEAHHLSQQKLVSLSSIDVYGDQQLDHMTPHVIEGFSQHNVRQSRLQADWTWEDWNLQLAMHHHREQAQMIDVTHDLNFTPQSEMTSKRAQCRLLRQSGSQIDITYALNERAGDQYEQTKLGYAQTLSPFSSRDLGMTLAIEVSTQPELPAWWMFDSLLWDPTTSNTFYEGHVRLLF